MSRALTVVSGATLALMMTAGTASAHECFVANRGGTPQGNAWFTIDIAEEVAASVASGELTAEQGECLVDSLPATIAVKVKGANGSDGVLMANNPNASAKGADGTGIEHVSAYFAACGISF